MWGGHALWAQEGKKAVVQVVEEGGWEKRFEVPLTAGQWAEAERLVGAHHFLTLTIPLRRGVAGEARPVITVVTRADAPAGVTQWKWVKDNHPGFDAVYEYLLGLCRAAAAGQPVREGRYESEWRPEWYALPA
jgi:hypothetical protein